MKKSKLFCIGLALTLAALTLAACGERQGGVRSPMRN